MEIKKTCTNCNRKFEIGVDLITVREGVTGIKGFIPLENTLYFCCAQCLIDYFDMGDLPNIPRRIP